MTWMEWPVLAESYEEDIIEMRVESYTSSRESKPTQSTVKPGQRMYMSWFSYQLTYELVEESVAALAAQLGELLGAATDALYVIVCRRETADALNYSLSARRYTLIVRQSLEKGKKHAHPMNMKSATLHERLLSQRTTEDRLGIMRKPFP
ncbi:hypothetical protein BHM03_00046286 [Ensete ventricosum]|nr:hypothetical protein BHM03_00046286 [Ensete ventricosum]